MRWKLLVLLVPFTAASLLSGCAVVRPWQRAYLAKRVMVQTIRVEEARCERTFFESREGATGGFAVGPGGGCACN